MDPDQKPTIEIKPLCREQARIEHLARNGGKKRQGGEKRLVLASVNRRLARHNQEDPHEPAMTGVYDDDARDPKYTLKINHAGKRIECWLAGVLKAGDDSSNRVHRFWGYVRKDGSAFDLYPSGPPGKPVGVLHPGEKRVRIELKGVPPMEFERFGNAPTLSDKVLSRLPSRHPLRAWQWTPLPRAYRRWLEEHLDEAELAPLLAEFQSHGGGDFGDLARASTARKLDRVVAWAFPARGGWHRDDLPMARQYARSHLSRRTWTHDEARRPLLDWLQGVVDRIEEDGRLEKPLPAMRDHLGLRPSEYAKRDESKPAHKRHEYKMKLSVRGLSGDFFFVGGGAFGGSLLVEKTTEPTWTATFPVVMGGGSAGLSVGGSVGFDTSGVAYSRDAWSPADFAGAFDWKEVGAHAGRGDVGVSAGGGAMTVSGKGRHDLLVFDVSGFSETYELGGGIEMGLMLGWIFSADEKWGDTVGLNARRVKVNDDYGADTRDSAVVHFKSDSALLNDDAWKAVRALCANELAALGSPGSELTIIGHADRRDSAERNVELTRLRAVNTLRAIRDIVGEAQFGIPDAPVIDSKEKVAKMPEPPESVWSGERLRDPDSEAPIQLWGLGEYRAAAHCDADRTENRRWRKVEIYLNGRLVLTLRGGTGR